METITKKINSAGFTLMELLVYVGAVVVLISAVVSIALWMLRAGAKIKTNYALANNAGRAMETMIYEIKKSESVYWPTSLFNTDPGQLSLEQSEAASGAKDKQFIDFFKCGQSLCEKKENGDPKILTGDQVRVTALTFRQINSSSTPSVQITLRLEPANVSGWGGSDNIIEITTAATLRPY